MTLPMATGSLLTGNLTERQALGAGFYGTMARRHGDVVGLRLASWRFLLLSHPDAYTHVFRKHPEHSYKQIVQCRDTRHPFPRTAAPAEQYVWSDTGWKSLKVNRHLARISMNALRVIATTSAELPQFVHDRRQRSTPWWQNVADRSEAMG